jgi:hypothetical protein
VPYGFFEGWSSVGPDNASTNYFIIDHYAGEMTVGLPPTTRDLVNVAWEPITASSITRSLDIQVPADSRNATFAVHSGLGYVQYVQPTDWGNGDVHLYVALGVNQDLWVTRTIDSAASPT